MLRNIFVVVATLVLAGTASGQSYPTKPVRIIVPYPAGQGSDIATRYLAEQLSKRLGQNFFIENRVGAGGGVGTVAASQARPDGYTLLLGATGTHAMNEYLYPSIGYDPEKDFEPITLTGMLPLVISVNPSFAATSFADLLQAAKEKPNTISVAIPSPAARMVHEFLRQRTGALFNPVVYKSSPTALAEVMGGQLSVVIDTVTATRPHAASGKLRALAITSLKTSELMPGVRSVAEQGVAGFEVTAWNALFAPKGTPSQIISALNGEVAGILALPQTRERLMQLGFEPAGGTPTELAAFIRAERTRWGQIIRAANLKAD